MSHYLIISAGLRGQDMPDNIYVVRVDTCRELAEILVNETNAARDAGYIGASKQSILCIAASIWGDLESKLRTNREFRFPCNAKRGDTSNYEFGIFVGHASRAEYLEFQADA